jgi:hypothetical protein
MAKYVDKNGNITFNSVQTTNFTGVAKLISHPDFSGATDADLADIAADNGGKLPSKVNAVEINWNGAQICNQTVNTTGQLLKIINDLYAQLNVVKVSSIDLDYSGTWQPTKLNETKKVTATIYPTNATNKAIQWSCTTSGLVKFSSSTSTAPTITVLKYGTGTVKCTAQDGSGEYGSFFIQFLEPTTTQPSPTDTPTDTPSETPTDDPTAPIYNSTILYGVRTTDSSTIKFTNYSDFSRVTSDSVPQGSSRTFTISGETLTWPTQRSNYVHIITNQNVEVVKAIVGSVTYSMGIGYRINGYNVFVIANSKAPATIGSGYDITIELYHSKTAITPSGYNGSSSGGSTSGSTTPSPTETPTDTPTNTPSNTLT